MSDSPSAPSSSVWTVLRQPSFARYTAGEVVSMLGTWMQQMAQGWVLAGLTQSNFTQGLVNFVSGVPMILFTMYGGLMADRHDKRHIILITLVVQAALAMGIGFLVGQNHLQVRHIVAAGICLGTVVAFEMPAAAALVPELVERNQLRAAIAVDRSMFHATRLAGPAIGGILIAKLGMAAAFYANALSFGALAVALLSIKTRHIEKPPEEEGQKAGMKEGLTYVRNDDPTFAMITVLASASFFISPFFMILMPNYSQHILHLRAEHHGFLMASSGIGAFAGSIWLFSIPIAQRRAYMFSGIAAITFAMCGLAVAQNLAVAIASMVVLTLGTSTIFGLANTIVQERAPDYIRGRVSAISGMSFFSILPFSGLLISKFSDLVGLRTAMASAAICFGIIAALLLYRHRPDEPAVAVGATDEG